MKNQQSQIVVLMEELRVTRRERDDYRQIVLAFERREREQAELWRQVNRGYLKAIKWMFAFLSPSRQVEAKQKFSCLREDG